MVNCASETGDEAVIDVFSSLFSLGEECEVVQGERKIVQIRAYYS